MKLETIYIWINKYKNLENKGFELSKNFKIEENFDKKNKNLTSLEIEKTNIPDYYPENVNLRAFVGKNGSGKSALIESILGLLSGFDIDAFMLFIDKEDNKIYKIGKTNGIKFKFNFEEINPLEINKNEINERIFNIYFNYAIDDLFSVLWEKIRNKYGSHRPFEYRNDKNFILIPDKSNSMIDINLIYRNAIIDLLYILDKENRIGNILKKISDNFRFKPKRFKFILEENRYLSELERLLEDEEKIQEIINLIEKLKKEDFSLFNYDRDCIERIQFKLIILYLTYFYFSSEENKKKLKKCIKEINNKNELQIINLLRKEDLNSLKNCLRNLSNIGFTTFLKDLENIKLFLYSQDIDKYLKRKKTDIFKGIPPYINVDVEDEKGRKFADLSFGEKLINTIFIRLIVLAEKLRENRKNVSVINLFYDEFDIGLHPEMQRIFISLLFELMDIFSEVLDKKIYFNIFLATHSPFIISDIPKENILFLEGGEKKEEFKEDENTFGANIYDILEKSFFLENSIGKYSAEFINTLSNLLFLIYAVKNLENNKYLALQLLEENLPENEISLDKKKIKEKLEKILISKQDEEEIIKGIKHRYVGYFLDKSIFENNKNVSLDKINASILKKENIKYFINNLIGDEVIKRILEKSFNRVKNEVRKNKKNRSI